MVNFYINKCREVQGMLALLLLFFTFSSGEANAQISASATSTVSTCNANGTITVTVSGGSAPYIYDITNGPLTYTNRPAQNNPVFNQLPPGNYTVQVRDNGGLQTTTQVTVNGTYKTPTVACNPVPYTSSIVLNTIDGLKPYRFDYTTDNGNTWAAFQEDSLFECLQDGDYRFRVTDACENFYPCTATVKSKPPEFLYQCSENVDGKVDFVLERAGLDYGELPITYILTDADSNTYTSTDGVFKDIPGCRFSILATDKCGKTFEARDIFCGKDKLDINIECIHFQSGSAVLSGFGGVSPYLFRDMKTGAENTNGIFENLTYDDGFFFEIADNCGNKKNLRIKEPDFDIAYDKCNFTGDVTISNVNGNYQDADVPGCEYTASCFYNFYPVNIECTNCIPAQSYEVREADRLIKFSQVFTGLATDEYYFTITDSCGNAWNETYDLRLTEILPEAILSCDSVWISACPVLPGFTYLLYDTNGVFIEQNTSGAFGGLESGMDYLFGVTHIDFPDTAFVTFTTDQLPPEYLPFRVTCNSFAIIGDPFYYTWNDPRNIPVTYELYDQSGNFLQSSLLPVFDSLAYGTYTFKATHPYCGERQNTVTISDPGKPGICTGPSYKYNWDNNSYEFAWSVSYTPSARRIKIRGGKDNIQEEFFSEEGIHELVLQPGKYFVETPCIKDTFELPEYDFKLEVNTYGMCPGYGRVEPYGWPEHSEFESFLKASGLDYCPTGNHEYRLYEDDWTPLYSFQNLPSGNFYHVVMMSGGYAPLDTVRIMSPFYVRSKLNSTFGAVCSSSPRGNITLWVEGGSPPYTFEMMNPPTGQIIVSRDSIVEFKNLEAGNYTFRVFDSCGISSDFATSVDALDFNPYYKRFCDGRLELLAPHITDAVYTWEDSKGTVVGDSYQSVVADKGAETYTVTIETSSCTFSKGITVPAQSMPDVSADAGPDIIAFEKNAQMQAAGAPAWASAYWTQISPSTGTTFFSDISDPNTAFEVSTIPGQYTYLRTVDGGPLGCIDYDTVVATFYLCDEKNNYSIQISPANSSCSVADGSASVTITPAQGNYKINWSNGSTSQSIQNLRPGTYSVTVTDDDICTPDQSATFTISGKVNIITNLTESLCEGQSFSVGKSTYTETGIYRDTLKNFLGCDSIVVTRLTVHPEYDIILARSVCEGDTVSFNGKEYTASGKYKASLKSLYGCDSMVTLDLTVHKTVYHTENATICSDESFGFGGKSLTETGQYMDIFISHTGCDSVVTLNLLVNPVSSTALYDTICEGNSYYFDTLEIKKGGNYTLAYQNRFGCDSIVTLTLTEHKKTFNTIDIQICYGESFSVGKNIYTETGIYRDTLSNFWSCDSVLTTRLTVRPEYDILVERTMCEGDTTLFESDRYFSSGKYTKHLKSLYGCDSVVTLELTVLKTVFTVTEAVICSNEHFSFGNNQLNIEGQYVHTFASFIGCDSIVTLNLRVNPVEETLLDDIFCEGEYYLFDSLDIGQAGEHSIIYKNRNGCDSTVYLYLKEILLPTIDLGDDKYLCAGFPARIVAKTNGGVEVFWEDGSTGAEFSTNKPGYYIAIASNVCGTSEDTVYVASGCDGCEAPVPNVFTPNGDGANDTFKPLYTCVPVESEFSVYNRWGHLVFRTDDYTEVWNGTYKGVDAMMDNYVWHLEFSYTFNGQIRSKTSSGAVLLVR